MGDINTPTEPETKFTKDAKATMASASILLASFRWKLRKAGFPFSEPPGIDAILRDIDTLCFPEPEKVKQKRQASKVAA